MSEKLFPQIINKKEKKDSLEQKKLNLRQMLDSLCEVMGELSNLSETDEALRKKQLWNIYLSITQIYKKYNQISWDDFDVFIKDVNERINFICRINEANESLKYGLEECLSESEAKEYGEKLSILGIIARVINKFNEVPESFNIDKMKAEYKKTSKSASTENSFPNYVKDELFDFFALCAKYSLRFNKKEISAINKTALVYFEMDFGSPLSQYGEKAELFHILYSQEGSEIKKKIDEKLSSSSFSEIEGILENRRRGDIEKKLFEKLNLLFQKKYKISNKHFAELLNYKSGNLVSLIESMDSIEMVQKGGVKILNEEYNICEFARYPATALLDQLKQKNEQAPYGLIILPRSDHNGAFKNMKSGISNISGEIKGKHLLRIFEASGKIDIARILLECNGKYGSNNKISFLVLEGHGQLNEIDLGSHLLDNSAKKEQRLISMSDFEGEGAKRIKEFFVKNPTIVLDSCDTGGEKGIGRKISSSYGAKVTAPEISVGALDIHAKYDNKGKIHFDVVWDKEEAGNTYVSGKKIIKEKNENKN